MNIPNSKPEIDPAPTAAASPSRVRRLSGSPWVAMAVAACILAGVAGALVTRRQKAPDIALTTLSGENITTQSMRGKVVLVNFWATSCVTCVHEMPMMAETFKHYSKDGLEFVAVAMSYDSPAYVSNYTNTRQLPFKVAIDVNGVAAKQFGDVEMTPTTFLIDKSGHIVKRYLGEPDFKELDQMIEKSLAA